MRASKGDEAMQMRQSTDRWASIVFVCVFLVVSISSSGECFAHMDRRITIEEDGTLVGIPSEYGPAALDVAFTSSAAGSPIAAVGLAMGNNHTRLPACMTGLLTTRSMRGIRASASWYHDESIVPCYLSLKFLELSANESGWVAAGHSLLFNLHTGRVLQMKEFIVRDGGRTLQEATVDLAARCSPTELDEILSDDHE